MHLQRERGGEGKELDMAIWYMGQENAWRALPMTAGGEGALQAAASRGQRAVRPCVAMCMAGNRGGEDEMPSHSQ